MLPMTPMVWRVLELFLPENAHVPLPPSLPSRLSGALNATFTDTYMYQKHFKVSLVSITGTIGSRPRAAARVLKPLRARSRPRDAL
jgi:hypothetical protein